jgi:hypothetical protein
MIFYGKTKTHFFAKKNGMMFFGETDTKADFSAMDC